MNIKYNPRMGECQRQPPVYFGLGGKSPEAGQLQSGVLKMAVALLCLLWTQKRELSVSKNRLMREQAKANAFEYTAIEEGI